MKIDNSFSSQGAEWPIIVCYISQASAADIYPVVSVEVDTKMVCSLNFFHFMKTSLNIWLQLVRYFACKSFHQLYCKQIWGSPKLISKKAKIISWLTDCLSKRIALQNFSVLWLFWQFKCFNLGSEFSEGCLRKPIWHANVNFPIFFARFPLTNL